MFIINISLLLLLSTVGAIHRNRARLLVSKNILNKDILEQKDLVIIYNFYNVGDDTAFNIKLNDENFNTQDFDVIAGSAKIEIPRIFVEEQFTHISVVRPRRIGEINITAAHVVYSPFKENKTITQLTLSSELGRRAVGEPFDPHYKDWCIFMVLASLVLFIPCILWYTSHRKYEKLRKKSKKKHALSRQK